MEPTERPRLPRDRLRELLLDAGAELLREDGLGSGTAPIGYAEVFRWLRDNRNLTVSRAQVHRRIWDSVGDFRLEVLSAIAASPAFDGYNAAVEEAVTGLEPEAVMTLSIPERQRLLVEFARKATRSNAEVIRQSARLAAFDAVYVLLSFGNEPANTAALQQSLRAGKGETIARFSGLYDHVAKLFNASPGADFGLDPQRGIHLFAELLDCVNHGAGGRAVFEPSLQHLSLGGEEWTVEGLVAAAVTKQLAGLDHAYAKEDAISAVPASLSPLDPHPLHLEDEAVTSGRMGRDELRQHMVDAGIAVLVKTGFGHGAEQITYSRVFERLRQTHGMTVSRAQVHNRIWRSQNDFQVDVLCSVIVRSGGMFAADSVAQIAEMLERTEITDVTSQRIAIASACRIGANSSVETLRNSAGWIQSKAVMAFHALNRDRSDQIGAALHDYYETDVANWATLFNEIARVTHYVPQPWTDCTIEELSVIVARCVDVLSEGAIGRARVLGEASTYQISVDGDARKDWSLFAIGVWCVVDFLAAPGPIEAGQSAI